MLTIPRSFVYSGLFIPFPSQQQQGLPLFGLSCAVRKEAYLILMQVVADMEWDPFLALRARTFFMEPGEEGASDSEAEEAPWDQGDAVQIAIREEGEGEGEGEGLEGGAGEDPEEGREGAVERNPMGAMHSPDTFVSAQANPLHGATVSQPQRADAAGKGAGGAEISGQGEEGNGQENGQGKGKGKGKGEGGEEEAPVEVCSFWLDELIHALYSDLAEYVEWRLHVQNVKRTVANEFETGGEYEESLDSASVDTDEEINAVKLFSGDTAANDWYRRGILGERLERTEEAERAHRAALSSATEGGGATKIVSCVTLLRMYVEEQQIKDALLMAVRLLGAVGASKEPAKQTEVPFVVEDALFHIISRSGLQALRKAQQQIKGDMPAAIAEVMQRAVECHVAGFTF